MGNDVCFLISVLQDGAGLLRCAVKVSRDSLKGDEEAYPMEPENRERLHAMLPQHVRSVGPIVEVETIFEIAA